jgi:hypothetical protein
MRRLPTLHLMRRNKYSADLSDLKWACFRLHLPTSKKPRWGCLKGDMEILPSSC